MEQQAAEKMGEAVSIVATVSTKGTGKKIMTAGVARQLGGALGGAAAETMGSKRAGSGLEGHSGYVVLAIGEKSLGLLKQKTGLLKPSCGDLLETIPLDQVANMELGGGALTSPLTIGLADGTEIELEVPRAHKGKVEKVKAALKL
jgi:hypothetical protein